MLVPNHHQKLISSLYKKQEQEPELINSLYKEPELIEQEFIIHPTFQLENRGAHR